MTNGWKGLILSALILLVGLPTTLSAQVVTTERHRLRVVEVVGGLEHPWGLAFLPDGQMLVTERPGRLRLIADGKLDRQPIGGLPAILGSGVCIPDLFVGEQ